MICDRLIKYRLAAGRWVVGPGEGSTPARIDGGVSIGLFTHCIPRGDQNRSVHKCEASQHLQLLTKELTGPEQYHSGKPSENEQRTTICVTEWVPSYVLILGKI